MIYGLWLSAAGLQVNEHRQAVTANNLANLNTTGFKRDLSVFKEREVESRAAMGGFGFRHDLLDNLSGGTWLNPTLTEFKQGALLDGGPLDVAIEGDGFLTVQVGDAVRYTRDGRFTLNEAGNLVTVAGGHPVLDDAGRPIRVGRVAPETVGIGGDGRIRVGEQEVGRLGLVDFADRTRLIKIGENQFDGRHAEPTEATGRIAQGFTEASGVEPTTELVRMIEASRSYQMNATMISYQDGMLNRLVSEVGRVA